MLSTVIHILKMDRVGTENILDRVGTGNILVLLTFLLMANIVIVFCISLKNWADWLVLQGLLLDVSGAIIIAIPDVPGLKNRATPKNLRKGWQKLNEDEELRFDNDGFYEILSLIKENTSRVDNVDDFEKISVLSAGDFGSRSIRASQDADDIANFGLTETVHLKRWIDVERDRKFRISGLLLLGSGFSLQLISYALQTFVITQS